MKDYDLKNLKEDTRQFLNSEYGKYIMSTLSEMASGQLSSASDMSARYPDRHLAKYSGIKEAIELFNQPLDDDQRVRG